MESTQIEARELEMAFKNWVSPKARILCVNPSHLFEIKLS